LTHISTKTLKLENLMDSNKTTQKIFMCDHCSKNLSSKRNLQKHYETCKEKIIKSIKNEKDKQMDEKKKNNIEKLRIIKEKDDMINSLLCDKIALKKKCVKLNKKHNELNEEYTNMAKKHNGLNEEYTNMAKKHNGLNEEYINMSKKHDELNEEYKELSKDYINYMKDISKQPGNNTINSNNTTINMNYIINNFTNALNFDDLMSQPLTKLEQQIISKEGPLIGAIKMLEDRCINNIKIPERPFHCVDTARSKYLIRNDDDWWIDNKGEKILGDTFNIVTNEVCGQNKNVTDIHKIIQNNTQLNEMRTKQTKARNHMDSLADIKNYNNILIN
jgi:hypothetical protein